MGLYRKVNGQLENIAGANSSGLPIGTIIPIYSVTVPVGFLPCDGSQYDTSQYPLLYALLGSDRLPDLRESTLVGIGTSDRTEITNHDVYTLGQFKDDQLQGHYHRLYGSWVSRGSGSGNQGLVKDYSSNYLDPYQARDIIDGVDGQVRVGTTTHGKQTGVVFIQKISNYAS